MVGNLSSPHYSTDNIISRNFLGHKLDSTVIYQYPSTCGNVLRQVFEGNRNLFVCTLDLIGSKDKGLSVFKYHRLAVFEAAYPDLGTLCIKQSRNIKTQLLSEPYHLLKTLFVYLMLGVREVEPRNVHTVLHKLPEDIIVISGRPYRTNYLRFFHFTSPYLKAEVIPLSVNSYI